MGAFTHVFEYRPGIAAVVPDFLSRLNRIVVKPVWLQRVSRPQHVDLTLLHLISCALGLDATFYFRMGREHPVVCLVHKDCNGLVLPSGDGFQNTVLLELYNAALRGHLGSAKTLEALKARIWWLRMYADVKAYVAACPR